MARCSTCMGPSRAGRHAAGLLHAVRFQLAGRSLGGEHRARRHHTTNPPPSDFTPVVGGNGGGPFTLAANANEVLVGVRGSTATYVQPGRPTLRACRPDRPMARLSGRSRNHWLRMARPAIRRSCPANSAISGFRGRFSRTWISSISNVGRLTSNGKLTGTGQFLGAVGRHTAAPRRGRGTATPAIRRTRFTGRSGSWMDNFGMQCRQATATTSIHRRPRESRQSVDTGGCSSRTAASASDRGRQYLTFSASACRPASASSHHWSRSAVRRRCRATTRWHSVPSTVPSPPA